MSDELTPSYSVVIPAYDSQATLDELCRRVIDTLERLGKQFEIILVDDCSTDQTWVVMERLHDRDARVKIIQLMRNVGQFRALMCGFHHARGELVITMDDDLQHPPEEIPKLISALNDDLDGVIGVPEWKRHHLLRNLGSRALRRLNRVFFRVPKGISMGSFRILKREIVQAMLANKSVNVTVGPLLLATTTRLANVNVEHRERIHGKTNYSLYRLIRVALDNVVSCSTLPLNIMGGLGLLVAALSFCFGVYVMCLRLFRGVGIPGWATIVVLLCFLSGCILFTLGIIGEYLIRIIREVSHESQFNVRKSKL